MYNKLLIIILIIKKEIVSVYWFPKQFQKKCLKNHHRMLNELICFKIFNQVFYWLYIFLIGNLKSLNSLKINLFKKIISFIELNNKILKVYEIVIYILYTFQYNSKFTSDSSF